MLKHAILYTRSKGISECTLGDELALMSVNTGKYYILNSVGKRVWEMIKSPINLEDIVGSLLNEYDVDHDTCSQEVTELLRDLENKTLIERLDHGD